MVSRRDKDEQSLVQVDVVTQDGSSGVVGGRVSALSRVRFRAPALPKTRRGKQGKGPALLAATRKSECAVS